MDLKTLHLGLKNMSPFESQPEKINQKIVLEIQAELLRRAGCEPEDNEKCENWINAYAEKFRKIAEADTALLELWKNDPETAVREIQNRLYGEEGGESAA